MVALLYGQRRGKTTNSAQALWIWQSKPGAVPSGPGRHGLPPFRIANS